ncbi:neurosecretory protein VGF [Eublepharis macularius]|uniref:Neurosecretory protein VGF n=1 Tax=Eublepharis macularius TaxID=481883 RepID=A0AA97K7A8_EUBMA|nr:neurosecretory protein VGF [Eublepharis macularius]
MRCPWSLRGAALLLHLCLQLQWPLRAAARPGEASPKTRDVPPNEIQARSLPEAEPDTAAPRADQDDLFQDVDPKALAAVLLQALHLEPEKPEEGPGDLEPSADEERVRSETKSSDLQPERAPGWKARKEGGQSLGEEMEALGRMLQGLQRYSPVAKREEQPQERRAAAAAAESAPRNDVLQELEEYERLRVHTKRKAPPSEPWEGARKLRQQQHLEHQLLQRRYEELAESRRQAEEARRAAAEEERLADMASDLLLQYLLKDGEDDDQEGDEGDDEEGERQASREGSRKGSALLFEDEESNVAEDKRSNEAPEEGGQEDDGDGDIDPNTIDRLIELSSKLHLPADDVIDIINDVEKKKAAAAAPEPLGKGKAPATPPRDKPKKNPAYPQGPKPLQKSYYPLVRQPSPPLPPEEPDSWNEVLRGDQPPAAKWFRAKPNNVVSNYINPRTFRPPAYPRHPHFPGPMVPRGEYYEESQAPGQELENYIEEVLRKRPQGF